MSNEVRIDINEKFLETFGTGTLTGTMWKKVGKADKVILVFHTSSLSYCQKNGGPRSWVMGDYVPMCLVQDIMGLQRMGIQVEIEEVKED